MKLILESGEEVVVEGGDVLDVTALSDNSILLKAVGNSPPPPPVTGENWVSFIDSLLQDADGSRNPGNWQFENWYFLDCVKDENNCGMHGAMLEGVQGVQYPSPTGTWYWQMDWDGKKTPYGIEWARNNTWPLPPATPSDRGWLDISAGEYDPNKGITWGWEEAGHLKQVEEFGRGQDLGKMFTRIYGRVGDGEFVLLDEVVGMTAPWGAGKTSPPFTVRRVVDTAGVAYDVFRLEFGGTLFTYNAGILWGAFFVGG